MVLRRGTYTRYYRDEKSHLHLFYIQLQENFRVFKSGLIEPDLAEFYHKSKIQDHEICSICGLLERYGKDGINACRICRNKYEYFRLVTIIRQKNKSQITDPHSHY